MKFQLLISSIALSLSLPLAAQFVEQTQSPNAQISTVQQAKLMSDDQMVWLEGYITGRAGKYHDDEYFFKDDSATIRVEIDDDVWKGQKVTPETKIRIWGEVDHHKDHDKVEIEVERLEIVQ